MTTATAAYFLRADEDDEGWSDRTSLIRASDGYEIAVDQGEPEDATFTRDYASVVAELNRLAADNVNLISALRRFTFCDATDKREACGLWKCPNCHARQVVEDATNPTPKDEPR